MKTAIQFSGGKDSLAVLYLMRPILNRATVYFGDTGDIYPHVRAFVHDTCAKLDATLRIIRPPMSIESYHAQYGFPSDIVPVEASLPMREFNKGSGPLLQSNFLCCAAMLWRPMLDALAADGVTNVYRGSKASDGHVGVPDGFKDQNGVTYHSPIWTWTDADVFQYLREVGAVLPAHYADANNSFDCLHCTAFLKSSGARDRLEWTRKNYPEEWPEIRRRLATIKTVIDDERAAIGDALSMSEVG